MTFGASLAGGGGILSQGAGNLGINASDFSNFVSNNVAGQATGTHGGIANVNATNPMANMPGVGGADGGQGMGTPLGLNLGTAGMAIQGIAALGNLWMSYQANKLARDNFNFQKDVTETNIAHKIQSYNTALGDRARSRGVMEGQTQSQVDQYVNDNKLVRKTG